MTRSCLNCQFCVVGYEHSKACNYYSEVPTLLKYPYVRAEACAVYKEYNRWDIDAT